MMKWCLACWRTRHSDEGWSSSGSVTSSNYNTRPRAAEVLVDGDSFKLVRRRETLDDLLAPELEVT